MRRLLGPVERFFAIESASGILLLLATVVALGWANSPWRDAYREIREAWAQLSTPDVAFGIVAGLLLGKLAGVVGFSLVAVRLGIAALPREVTFRCLVVLGLVAGIGFTMALFVARMAFQEQPHLYGVAQLAILSASGLAALATLLVGRHVLPSPGTRMPASAPAGGGPGALEREPR